MYICYIGILYLILIYKARDGENVMELDCLSCTCSFTIIFLPFDVLLFSLNVKDPDCLSCVPLTINNTPSVPNYMSFINGIENIN